MRQSWRYPRSVFLISLLLYVSLMVPPVWADIITVGVLSFDTVLPGPDGVNGFDIDNFTGDPSGGGSALPPDFPVLTPLIFQNSAIILTYADGTTENIPLGEIGPGFFPDLSGALQFPDTTEFQSATLTGTFSESPFLLSDGRFFNPDTLVFSAELLPSIGTVLVAGIDFTLIEATGTFTPVPLPAVWLLFGSGLVGLGALMRKRFSNHKGPSPY